MFKFHKMTIYVFVHDWATYIPNRHLRDKFTKHIKHSSIFSFSFLNDIKSKSISKHQFPSTQQISVTSASLAKQFHLISFICKSSNDSFTFTTTVEQNEIICFLIITGPCITTSSLCPNSYISTELLLLQSQNILTYLVSQIMCVPC